MERLVRAVYAGWAAQDFDAAIEPLAEDFVLDWTESRAPFRGVYRGRAAVYRFWEDVRDAWEDFLPRIEEVVDAGRDRLVTRTTVTGRGRGSGLEITAHGAVVWTFRDGAVASGKLFQNVEDALAAAAPGLEETAAPDAG
jgi:ketosteroid isomerase-like protein